MTQLRVLASLLLVCFLAACPAEVQAESAPPFEISAFPTAEGFGKYAKGGRGGAVFEVGNLNDSGVGSLRACAEATRPRTCVFRVSGTIELSDWIIVDHPYLTIAGQTSPGGVALKNGASKNATILVRTHDVVIRHLRLRPGPSREESTNVDTIQVSGNSDRVILDHLSTSWPTDEGINVVGAGHEGTPLTDARNITIQWSILAEGLHHSNRGAHSRGTYFGYGARNITFHHNLIASNLRRNPLLNTRDQFDMINNIIYNSGQYNGEFYTRFGDLSVNMLGNIAILGPSSRKTSALYLGNYFKDFPAEFSIYLDGNIDINRRTNEGDQRLVIEPNDWQYVSAKPLGLLSVAPAMITNAERAYHDVIAAVGATAPVRDTADARIISELQNCAGAIIDDPSEVGGWPVFANISPPLDTDHDGMPDSWEDSHSLAPDNAEDRNGDLDGDGYTNLEEYINELAGDNLPHIGLASGRKPDPDCGFDVKKALPGPRIEISATPADIRGGEASTITWGGENLMVCKSKWGGFSTSGSIIVKPKHTTLYVVTCVSADGQDDINSVVVTVDGNGRVVGDGDDD